MASTSDRRQDHARQQLHREAGRRQQAEDLDRGQQRQGGDAEGQPRLAEQEEDDDDDGDDDRRDGPLTHDRDP